MGCQKLCAVLVGAVAIGLPRIAMAQFPPPPAPPTASAPTVQDRWPDPPAPKPRATRPAPTPAEPQTAPERLPAEAKLPAGGEEALHAPAHHRAPPHAPAQTIACRGLFARDSTHLKLAAKFDARNIVFGQVDGTDGSKIPASILFPDDPKRRLEVLWKDDAAHSDISVVAINGQSQWIAPRGLRLGLGLAALEKLNGRPFKLSGFGADGAASVLDWQGGALSVLPGGCKVGVRLSENANAPQAAREAVAGDKELLSNNVSVRAAKPAVREILIGY